MNGNQDGPQLKQTSYGFINGIALNAKASSELPITYTISGNIATVTGAGTISIRAHRAAYLHRRGGAVNDLGDNRA